MKKISRNKRKDERVFLYFKELKVKGKKGEIEETLNRERKKKLWRQNERLRKRGFLIYRERERERGNFCDLIKGEIASSSNFYGKRGGREVCLRLYRPLIGCVGIGKGFCYPLPVPIFGQLKISDSGILAPLFSLAS